MNLYKGVITNISMARGVNIRGGFVYQYTIAFKKHIFQMRLLKETKLSVNQECYVIYSPGTINLIIDIFKSEDFILKKRKYTNKKYLYGSMVFFCYFLSGVIFFKLKEYSAFSIILVFIGSLGLKAVFEMASFVKILNEAK